MELTESTFSVTFDGRSVVRVGGDLLDTLPEHVFPVQFGTSSTPVVNRAYPRLDAFGNLSMSFSIATVQECDSHMGAWRKLYAWLEEWKTAGKGVFMWDDGCGHGQRFEAIITDAEPKVSGLFFIVSYGFTLGRPL